MRLDKYLSNSGLGSRKEIKEKIRSGSVCVNGNIITDPAFHVNETDDNILCENQTVSYKKYIYLMLNKPAGYVCALYDKKFPVTNDLVPKQYSHFGVFPIGRLDMDTVGLLILTNDGNTAHRITSPKSHVDKTYYVKTAFDIKKDCTEKFLQGVVLDDGYKTMSAYLEIKGDRECFLTVREGKFHQVKRMFEAVENKVVYLKRVKIGELCLDGSLAEGEIRELTDVEIKLMERGRYK